MKLTSLHRWCHITPVHGPGDGGSDYYHKKECPKSYWSGFKQLRYRIWITLTRDENYLSRFNN